MVDWLIFVIALVIIATLVGFFGFLTWKMNMSDSLIGDDNNQYLDSINDKKKKDKNNTEQGKKKRKDQKKSKRDTKNEEEQEQQQKRNKQKEPITQTSEETDDEREESEQELLPASLPNAETSSNARKRNKNKTQTNTSTHTQGNVKNEKNPNTNRAPPVTHPKLTQKDELESTKQQTKVQVKSSQGSNKQTLPATSTTTKKPTQPIEKQQQQQQEEPFTVVGSNRHKTAAPSSQQQQQKTQVNATQSTAPVPQPAAVQVQHNQLAQRQQPLQKETPAQLNGSATNPLPVKQQPQQPQQQQPVSTVRPKVADLIKVLPSSQVVVTELMTALDAFPLSADELDIIMHKIANKQSVIKQDWTKLQHGQKVDPQVHIGQVMDESAKAYEDDMKNNSIKRIKELTDELNQEKRRNNDLLKEKHDNEREIQILHAQLDSVQHKQQQQPTQTYSNQQIQNLELQLKRITEENIHLNQQLTQQITSSNLTNTGNSSNVQVQVLSEQIKKLSVDNAHWEKKAHSNELLAKEAHKEKEDLIRYNEQLTQSLETSQKELKHIEDKHHKQYNDNQITHLNEINDYKRRIEQLENENEQLRREDIVHVEPTTTTDIQTVTLNNEEREQYEKDIYQLRQTIELKQQKENELNDFKQKLTDNMEEYKKQIDNLHTQYQSKENELRQEIERIKQEKNHEQQEADESRNTELNTLRTELNEIKSRMSQSEEHLRQEREKQRNILIDLLPYDLRNQLHHDHQDFDQWLSSYRQLFESNKRSLHEECDGLKRENEELRKNMTDIENQLKEIERTVQSKEEKLLNELKNKDVIIENNRHENEQLNGELQRLRNDIQQLQSAYNTSINEARTLKTQLDERLYAASTSSPVVTDESFELIKQPSPSLSAIVIDIRPDQLNDLIRSHPEGSGHHDSAAKQLNKHLHDIHHGENSETSNINETTVTSSDHQS